MFWCKKIHIVLIVLIGLLIGKNVGAQPTHLQLKQLSTEDGLSSSFIISLLQDHKGFMWIGTIEGLSRYDGSEFKVYKHDRLNPISIPDNFIISMLLDDEKMYVGTNAGISMYNPFTDGFINFSEDSTSCLYNHTFQVRAMAKGSGESLYIASNIGLIVFDPVQNTFENISIKSGTGQISENSKINSVCVDGDDNLLLGTTEGLWLFNTKTKKFQLINKGIGGEDYSTIKVNKIVEDKTGEIWLTCYYSGLFRVDKSKTGDYRLVNSSNSSSITKHRLLSLAVDSKNNLWIGAENDGVFIFNREKQNFSHFLSSDSDPLYTTTYSVECLYFDNSENLWLGTFANGVNVVAKNGDAIVSYAKFKGGDLGVTNNMVNAFIEDKNGNVWVATDGGGVQVLDRTTGWFKTFNTKNSKIQSDYILSMAEDNDKIWLSTWGNGLLCFNQKTGVFQSFNTSNSNIPDNDIFNIAKGFNNDLWLGSFSHGLVHYFPKENRFVTYSTDNSEIGDNYVNVVRLGTEGNLFIGTRAGVVSFDIENEKFKKYSLLDLDAKTLSNLHVYDILFENDTSVWAATLSGLNRINPKTGKNVKFTVQNGLPSNNVRGVLKDESGSLWVATTKGVCKFDENMQGCHLFAKEDGLLSDEIRPRSVLKDSEGNLYFGGINGFNIIYPEKLETNENIPEVLITGLDIFNETVVPSSEGSPLTHTISETEELRLRYDQSVLTFYFAVLDYTRPSKNQHAYMLENFDKDWIYCGSKREVTYTNLDPGTYVLRVKGSNNDGIWNEEGVSLSIIIVPPWWATWWFKSIIGLTLLALIFSIYYSRVSTLKKQKQILEKTVQERTKELAEINATKDKLFSIIAHDLRSPFNTILGFTNLLLEKQEDFDKKTTRRVLKDLQTSGETAFSLLENLLNWSLSQQNQIEFKPETISLDVFIPEIIEEFQAISTKKKIRLIDKRTVKNTSVYSDYNMLSVVFRNLITNAIKFSYPETEVCLDAKESEDGSIIFSVADHGVGLEQEKVDAIFKLGEQHSAVGTQGEKGTGLGLILSKEFITKHKGRIWVESELGKGSTFYFTVPASEDVYVNA